jgi:glycogen debranching enzyme
MRETSTLQENETVSMHEAVGYSKLDCSHEATLTASLVLKHGRWFLVSNRGGDITPPGRCGLGLFRDDTRLLSHYELTFAGGPAALLSMQVPYTYGAQIDLAINDLAFDGEPWEPRNCIHIRRELLLDERFVERVTLTNFLRTPIDFWMELSVASDFADIFEVRGWHREHRGEFFRPQVSDDGIGFAYRGRDGALVRSEVQLHRRPTVVDERRARWELRLEPGAREQIEWQVIAPDDGEGADGISRRPIRVVSPHAFDERRMALSAEYEAWRSEGSQWATDVDVFDVTLARAVDDLHALYIRVDGADVVSAGIPWYSTIFGRDSIITSLQTLPLNPRMAIETLRYLARRQGAHENAYTEEQPGKILHELRRGEMARSGEIPHVPYYGSVDATPLWLVLLHETWRWTGDHALVRELLPNAERALAWIDRFGDADGDGFVEYSRTSDRGLVNQGWKDSSDGVPFPDGRLPSPPIALAEVQGYVYDAKVRAAVLFEALGDPARAATLRAEADTLRAQILDRFWLEDLGTFAIALDRSKRPIPTVASNAGHLLWSRVATPEQAARVVATLTGPDMFSGWGIRTLSAAHRVYNPMSYHNGSVWPHDNALMVLGMSHYGLVESGLPVISAFHAAASQLEFNRLPELFCGMSRGTGLLPVAYPVSCSPLAWASGACFMLLQAALGLLPDAADGVLHIRDPRLPDFLNELTVTGLRVGRSRVALQFRRHGDRTLANLLGVDGAPLHVRIELR